MDLGFHSADATVKDLHIPEFNEVTLSTLTQKISKGLEVTENSAHPAKRNAQPVDKKRGAVVSKGGPKTSREQERGSKRDRNGNIKQISQEIQKPKVAPSILNKIERDGAESAELLQEILALGGDAADFDLVADVVSESELEEDIVAKGQDRAQLKSKALQKDIADLIKGVGPLRESAMDTDSDDGDMSQEDEGERQVPQKLNNGDTRHTEQSAVNISAAPTRSFASHDNATKDDSARLIFEPRPDWHAAAIPVLPPTRGSLPPSPTPLIHRIHQYAISLLEADNQLYASKQFSATSSHRFLSTITSSGTLSDKISALTLVIQESPVHTMKAFETLLGLARKRSRGQAVTALGALKDLLAQGMVLPPERKLRAFRNQPGLQATLHKMGTSWKPDHSLPSQLESVHLIYWAYEDWLKNMYFDMLKILESWCSDEVEFARGRAITYVWELLKEKPEQESNLLRLLVNKLGDPNKKIASKTSFLLLQLQTTHPLMKPIIVSSIQSELLFRPGQSPLAKYYAIITLNQTVLSGKEESIAGRLLEVYFGLFVSLLNRPHSAAGMASGANLGKTNKKGQIQGGGGPMGKKAKQKANAVDNSKKFEEELNEKMVSAVLTGVNRAIPFSKTDDSTITHSSNFNTSVQALTLIHQLCGSKQNLIDRYYRTLYESLLDPRLLSSSKQAMYLNLVFRSLKSDLNVKRVKAFIKRLLQISALHQPPFVCGVLHLLKELEENFSSLQLLIDQHEEQENQDEEKFLDAPEDRDDQVVERSSISHADGEAIYHRSATTKIYDARKRDPEHSNADKSCLWELTPYLAHFHPSVSTFAQRLMHHESTLSKPDLSLHTLIHFLDKFVYRNAKSISTGARGSSIMQPLAGSNPSGRLLSSCSASKDQFPVNSESFWRLRSEDVAVDEVFFHKYFNQVGKGRASTQKKKANEQHLETGENGDDDDDDDDDEIWKALVESRPELEGSDEGDSDLEMEGLQDDSVDKIEASEEGDEEGDEEGSVFNESVDLEFESDEDALLGSDDDVPSDLGSPFQKELEGQAKQSGVFNPKKQPKTKRRKLKHLPTFASLEDYADRLDAEGEC
ncbi:MAG: hypothetical protein M1827_006531 [Pycnora praestabilis]|nr:MAG: hypothetical protein M1827_006531 [Pycnora praestabilis]